MMIKLFSKKMKSRTTSPVLQGDCVVYFFAADCNERAHMHVKKGDGNGKIWIKPKIEVYYLKGFKQKEKRQIA